MAPESSAETWIRWVVNPGGYRRCIVINTHYKKYLNFIDFYVPESTRYEAEIEFNLDEIGRVLFGSAMGLRFYEDQRKWFEARGKTAKDYVGRTY